MRCSLVFLLALFSSGAACTSGEPPVPPPENPETQPSKAPSESTTKLTPIDVRGLFYYERITPSGVQAFPSSTEHETRGPGEQAWLEVHTSGASHAYAFALLSSGAILKLWSEDIKIKEHTPPMDAFNDGLSLTQTYSENAELMVVASQSPIDGLDEMTDCVESNPPVCETLRGIHRDKISSNTDPVHTLRMKHMNIETPAYGAMSSGEGLAALSFSITAP